MNWTIFGITIALAGFILPLFTSAGQAAADNTKEKLRDWLKSIKRGVDKDSLNWAKIFIEFFDKLYSRKFFSMRRIIMSFSTSFLLLFIIYLPWFIFGYDRLVEVYSLDEFSELVSYKIVMLLGLGAIFNLIPDYIPLQ